MDARNRLTRLLNQLPQPNGHHFNKVTPIHGWCDNSTRRGEVVWCRVANVSHPQEQLARLSVLSSRDLSCLAVYLGMLLYLGPSPFRRIHASGWNELRDWVLDLTGQCLRHGTSPPSGMDQLLRRLTKPRRR